MHLEGTEFMSIWKLAHEWANVDVTSTSAQELPQSVKDNIHLIIVGHFRGDLPLRKGRLYIDQSDESILAFIINALFVIKLNKCLSKNYFDQSFLDSLRVARGQFIRWCEKEYRSPPECWTPQTRVGHSTVAALSAEDAHEEKDLGWYDNLTDRQKERATTLGIAKKLWSINPEQTYEQVRQHEAVRSYGYPQLFNEESFKRWTRSFAPEYAKRGGRPIKSRD